MFQHYSEVVNDNKSQLCLKSRFKLWLTHRFNCVLEEGDYLALDLGGTNFRMLLCKMRQGKCESLSRNYNVPTEKLHGPAKAVSKIHPMLLSML